jgi:hypothetical protein
MSRSRRGLIVIVGVAIVAVAVTVTLALRFHRGDHAWVCAWDSIVPSAARAATEKVALDFVDAAMGPDPSSADAFFAASVEVETPDKLGEIYRARQNHLGALRARSVAHTYLTRLMGGDGQRAFVMCGYPSQPEEVASVLTRPGDAQAHVVVEGRTDHNAVTFVLWLVRERDQWRVLEADVRPSGYMGKAAVDFEQMADAELHGGRNLNAKILYTEALALADRGPTLQLGIVATLESKRAAVEVPGPLAGPGPFRWTAGTSAFSVLSVRPISLGHEKRGDQLYIIVFHEIEPWIDNASIERKNRELIASFDETYPEYKSVFGGLVIKGCEKGCGEGARMWGTVHDKE